MLASRAHLQAVIAKVPVSKIQPAATAHEECNLTTFQSRSPHYTLDNGAA